MTARKQTRKKSPSGAKSSPQNSKETGGIVTRFQPGHSGNPARQWKPGQSGNPGGRPRTHGLLQVLRAAVDLVDADGHTIEEKLIGVLVEEALEGRNRLPALALIFDRLEGRAPQQLDINNITKAIGSPQERIDALLKLAAEQKEGSKE